MFVRSIVLVLATFCAFCSNESVSETRRSERTQNQMPNKLEATPKGLQVSVLTDKVVYKLEDTIKLQAMITNTSKDTLYVYGILSWGYSASFTLHVSDDSGKEVETAHFDDSIAPPPPPNDKNTFVRLYPRHFLGTNYSLPLNELNSAKPGQYTVVVEYHSPISASAVQLTPYWGKEKGSIRSMPISIKVTK